MVNVYLYLIDQNYLDSANIVLNAVKNLLTLYQDIRLDSNTEIAGKFIAYEE